MTTEPPARPHDPSRFALPADAIPPGRSQPKRLPPRRTRSQWLRRTAIGIGAFSLALVGVALLYGVLVSADFRSLCLENGATAAVALLIGCFALPGSQRRTLTPGQHLTVCLAVIAITPWTYQLGNQLEAAGMSLATGLNFVFEILLAVGLYRLAGYCRPAAPLNPAP